MGGSVPGGKPKESAGKPVEGNGTGEPAATAIDGGTGGTGGMGGTGGTGEAEGGTDEGQPGPTAKLGRLDVEGGRPSGRKFGVKPNDKNPSIETFIYQTKTKDEIIIFKAKMDIDNDGRNSKPQGDTTHQNQTAFTPGGKSLDPGVIPFVVIPIKFDATHPKVKLGDYAVVTYRDRSLYAIVGDVGPENVLGEGSTALAKGVGIPHHPVTGGIKTPSVEYYILSGSGKKFATAPTTSAQVQENGRQVFEAAGAPMK